MTCQGSLLETPQLGWRLLVVMQTIGGKPTLSALTQQSGHKIHLLRGNSLFPVIFVGSTEEPGSRESQTSPRQGGQ